MARKKEKEAERHLKNPSSHDGPNCQSWSPEPKCRTQSQCHTEKSSKAIIPKESKRYSYKTFNSKPKLEQHLCVPLVVDMEVHSPPYHMNSWQAPGMTGVPRIPMKITK
jgi:hypothetical protein